VQHLIKSPTTGSFRGSNMISSFVKEVRKHQSYSEKAPLSFLESQIVGRSAVIRGPLKFIEDFILEKVLPYYANTHTEASYTGKYISELREEARYDFGMNYGL